MNGCHASPVEVPRGDAPLHLLDNSALLNLTVLGDLLWAVAYILIIRQCFRQRTYGLPLAAIVMNFTWELQYSLVQPPRCDDGTVDIMRIAVILAWVALDALIVWQLFRYGRNEQTIAEIRRHFPLVVLGSLVLASVGNFTFARFHPTEAAPLSGVIINFVMSILFVFFVFARPDLRGITWGSAVARVAGNSLIFFANIFLLKEDPVGTRAFVLFLFAGTALFDLAYLVLVHSRRQAGSAASAVPA